MYSVHEWRVWREVKIPDGKIFMPGVIDHTTDVREHPEVIADRIVNYANVVERGNVIAGPDIFWLRPEYGTTDVDGRQPRPLRLSDV
jgi:methionine synthase II (cobalamin-independent)